MSHKLLIMTHKLLSCIISLTAAILPPNPEKTDQYKLRKFLRDKENKVTKENVVFGHKIFHFPTLR